MKTLNDICKFNLGDVCYFYNAYNGLLSIGNIKEILITRSNDNKDHYIRYYVTSKDVYEDTVFYCSKLYTQREIEGVINKNTEINLNFISQNGNNDSIRINKRSKKKYRNKSKFHLSNGKQ